MKVLLTGGAGYIGTHTAVELIDAGHDVVIIDNLINSSAEAVRRVEQITGTQTPFVEADVRDKSALDEIFTSYNIDAVMHLAGLKAIGESVEKPLRYYRNNLDSSLALVETMQKHGVHNLIFSSSATVYGTPEELPLTEQSRVGAGIANPYGQTKYMIEQMLIDIARADPKMNVTILRYFNPIGAHESGLIGEDPSDIPNNLMPYIAQTAIGKHQTVKVFGNDYDTSDGTGVRDYIHVVDVATGHVTALEHSRPGVHAYNLATGQGTSVLELIDAFSIACGHPVSYIVVNRRPGDIAACYADASKAHDELGWKATRSLMDACRDTWKWQSKNPDGYQP